MKILKTTLFLYLMSAGLLWSCQQEEVLPSNAPDVISSADTKEQITEEGFGREDNLALGNPSGAVASSRYYWNYLLSRSQYSMSYHRERGTPNWVSWHLNSDWLGNTSRSNRFVTDNALPSGWYRVKTSDYTNSGFDRGHNCPSADRNGSRADNDATFYMTNMIPQAPNLNRRLWADFENYLRKLVSQGNEIYVVMGSYGTGGTGSNGYLRTVNNGKVTIPSRVWKVALIIPEGRNDLSRINTNTRVIAVDIPNNNNLNSSWASYRTTVDAIEAQRRYDLFSKLPSSIQGVIEARVDRGPTR